MKISGAEPSPAYFNILMWGEREEVLDGTQLAADWTFSGLQKFGQGLLDRLRGLRLNAPLLEKVITCSARVAATSNVVIIRVPRQNRTASRVMVKQFLQGRLVRLAKSTKYISLDLRCK